MDFALLHRFRMYFIIDIHSERDFFNGLEVTLPHHSIPFHPMIAIHYYCHI